MSHSQRDKDYVYDRYAFNGDGSAQNALRKLSEFIAIHIPERREFERDLLENLQRALLQARRNIKSITTPEKWDLDKLTVESYGKKKLRKPRVVVDIDVTSKENLTVRWYPHPDSNDFTFSKWELQTRPPYRPINEIFFSKGFGDAIWGTDRAWENKQDKWSQAVRLRIAEITLACVKDLLEEVGEYCDVTLDSRIVTENDPETGLITSWRFENLEMIEERERVIREANAEQARIEREAAELSWTRRVQSVIDEAEATYGIPAPRLIGLIDAIREHKVDFPGTLSLLETKFGMKPADPDINHVGNTRAIRRAMRDLGVAAEAVSLRKEDVVPPKARREPEATSSAKQARNALADRLKRRIAVHASMAERPAPQRTGEAPDYSRLRSYAASAEELVSAGVSSVEELVSTFNEAGKGTVWAPVSQADYPTTKAKFDRLAERMEKVVPRNVQDDGMRIP